MTIAPAPAAEAARPGPAARPFLKWAGGKAQLLPALLARTPAGMATYFEPFLGGGALFFALMADPELRPRRAVLNDLNPELAAAYEVVRDDPTSLAAALEPLAARYLAADDAGREALFYAVRAERPREPVEVAARLLFLNKTCFNGLYRVNRRGEFNVPHGRYRTPHILDRDALVAASAALRGVEVRCGDFEEACSDARAGDFVYFDPPFHPLSATSSFTAYTAREFGIAEQKRLKRVVDRLTKKNVPTLVSNSPHPIIEGGYVLSDYNVEHVPARRAINSRGDKRGPIAELMIDNYGLCGAKTK